MSTSTNKQYFLSGTFPLAPVYFTNRTLARSTILNGNTVEQVLNGRGDTVRTVTLVGDANSPEEKRYIATVTHYNLRGLPTARSKPFYIIGADNRFTHEPPEPTENPLAWSELRQYDANGRLESVVQIERGDVILSPAETTTYQYDLTGNLSQNRYPNGIVHDFVYDLIGRLDLVEHWQDADSDGRRDPNELRAQFDYTLRADGKRTGVTEKHWNAEGQHVVARQLDTAVVDPVFDRQLESNGLLAGAAGN